MSEFEDQPKRIERNVNGRDAERNPERNPGRNPKRISVGTELFKMLVIPLTCVVILLCLKNMSLSYVFAERVITSQHLNDSRQLTPNEFRNRSQCMAEAIANINAMWVGLHAIGLYAAIVEDVFILWVFSTLETLADILCIIYWTNGFYPLVLPDMCLLSLYFFMITVFSWIFTLSLI